MECPFYANSGHFTARRLWFAGRSSLGSRACPVGIKTFKRSSKAGEERTTFVVDTDTGFAGIGWWT
jgi:hypothetical protein